MKKILKSLTAAIIKKTGYAVVRDPGSFGRGVPPADMADAFKSVYKKCRKYTMTSVERMYAVYQAMEYIEQSGVRGDLVECGVWKGGTAMMMAYLLAQTKGQRKIYLYDTFTGMSEPTEKDVRSETGQAAIEKWKKMQKHEYNEWAYCSLEDVKKNIAMTGYRMDNVVFIQGKVEETIPRVMPSQIALLRLDTDWFESTYHELQYLYPILSPGGVLIIDDYGHWKGAKEAVDRYLAENKISILLNRTDSTGRIGVKK